MIFKILVIDGGARGALLSLSLSLHNDDDDDDYDKTYKNPFNDEEVFNEARCGAMDGDGWWCIDRVSGGVVAVALYIYYIYFYVL